MLNLNQMKTMLLFAALTLLLAGCHAPADTLSPSLGDIVVDFIRDNPDRSALYLGRNDTTLLQRRADRKFPLASTVKIIVAIEFAKQAAAGKINPDELILVSDLDRYYLPGTDGNAHPNWKQQATTAGQLAGGRVPLREVAKGMIRFSSNANTEYLMERLGLDAVNANLRELNLSRHDQLYPLVSSLFLYSTTDKAALTKRLSTLTTSDYTREVAMIHARLRADSSGAYKQTFIFPDMALQKLWSDRLTASTVREYAGIMQKIQSRTYYSPAVQTQLDPIMEWIFEANPANKTVYQHIGMKGGSTAFVLTLAMYATTTANDRVQMVVFFNNLTTDESALLNKNLNTFLQRCTSPVAYKTVVNALRP